MKFCVIDYESEYDSDYTLTKLSTEEYLRDKRFKAHGAALKFQANIPARWYPEKELRWVLANEDWSDTFMVCHHGQFDHAISAWHYNVHPKMLGDTLAMSRLLLGNHTSVSLDSVRKHFGFPPKTTPYHAFRGKTWEQLTPAEQEALADGCCDEVESIWKIFGLLHKDFPPEEYAVIDTTIRMFVEPILGADVDLLAKVWEDEARKKAANLAALNVTAADLQSANRFADLLRECGVEPETKDGKNGPIFQFAKTDPFMQELLEHDDDRVRTLAEARLGQKSSLMQTRAETLGWMASRGPLCVYLRYAGAGTLRVSGGDGANWLNFKRRSAIRKAILAPPGYLLAPVDSSQIECRVLHWLAGGPDDPVLQQFRDGLDPYAILATGFYGEKIYKPAPDDPRKDELEAKRGAGKQARLMCGYGSGPPKYQATARAGLYGPRIDMDLDTATRHVNIYRDETPSVCAKNTGYWAQAGRMLSRLAGGEPADWGPLHIRDKRIYLPNGCPLIYDTLEFHRPDGEEREKCREFETDGYWRVRTRHGWKTMWGSKLVQNICEAVSRVIVSQAMTRITNRGFRVLNWPYDELLILVKRDGTENQQLEWCLQEMRRTPDWLPGLPLDAEGSLGERYSK